MIWLHRTSTTTLFLLATLAALAAVTDSLFFSQRQLREKGLLNEIGYTIFVIHRPTDENDKTAFQLANGYCLTWNNRIVRTGETIAIYGLRTGKIDYIAKNHQFKFTNAVKMTASEIVNASKDQLGEIPYFGRFLPTKSSRGIHSINITDNHSRHSRHSPIPHREEQPAWSELVAEVRESSQVLPVLIGLT